MPRRIIKRYLPEDRQIRDHKYLRVFGKLLHDPNLWHLNRYSVAGGFAAGLFCALLPMPFEMVAAALAAVVFRVNLPISVALVWISNPFTWIPLYGTAYLFGAWLLGLPAVSLDEITLGWLLRQSGPLWLGSVIIGAVFAAIGYFAIQALWRLKVKRNWEKRRAGRRATHGVADNDALQKTQGRKGKGEV